MTQTLPNFPEQYVVHGKNTYRDLGKKSNWGVKYRKPVEILELVDMRTAKVEKSSTLSGEVRTYCNYPYNISWIE